MSKKISVFYHCVFLRKDAPTPHAQQIIQDQMQDLASSGLLAACSNFVVGVNGGTESVEAVRKTIPSEAMVRYHGLESISESLTMVLMWEYCLHNPGEYVFYFHSKGATHTDHEYLKFVARWRSCMMRHCVMNWKQCEQDLNEGFESCGCHWMTNMSPPSDKDSIWGGNFFWATTDFIATLPDLLDRELIRTHGVTAPIARYEGERWIGSGPRLPKIKDYHVNGIGQCP